MKKVLRKIIQRTGFLFVKDEIRAVNKLLSNKNIVYKDYYIEL